MYLFAKCYVNLKKRKYFFETINPAEGEREIEEKITQKFKKCPKGLTKHYRLYLLYWCMIRYMKCWRKELSFLVCWRIKFPVCSYRILILFYFLHEPNGFTWSGRYIYIMGKSYPKNCYSFSTKIYLAVIKVFLERFGQYESQHQVDLMCMLNISCWFYFASLCTSCYTFSKLLVLLKFITVIVVRLARWMHVAAIEPSNRRLN